MAEFCTPIKARRNKEEKVVDGNDKICIPPSPFLNRLGYGTGKFYYILYFNICYSNFNTN